MIEHSPHEIASGLRDHLATHDKPLVFLLGAGTSACIEIPDSTTGGTRPLVPAVAALTTLCLTEVGKLGTPYVKAWEGLLLECKTEGLPQNVESVLSRTRAKIAAMGDGDTSCGLTRTDLRSIENAIAKTIVREATPAETAIPRDTPHDLFARWVAQTSRRNAIEVFTTNYDVLVERSFENARVPVFDGFIGSYQPFFAPEIVEDTDLMPPTNWVRVWKLHGSVNWGLVDRHGVPRVVRSEKGNPALILPSQLKYIESRKEPYLALTDRLSKALRRDATLLVSIGFSFSDQHLNNIVFDALDSNPLTHLICLAHHSLGANTGLRDHAIQRKNVILVARDGAVVGGHVGTWSKSALTTSYFQAADTNPNPAGMLLGDFNVYARFLSEMHPDAT